MPGSTDPYRDEGTPTPRPVNTPLRQGERELIRRTDIEEAGDDDDEGVSESGFQEAYEEWGDLVRLGDGSLDPSALFVGPDALAFAVVGEELVAGAAKDPLLAGAITAGCFRVGRADVAAVFAELLRQHRHGAE